MITHFLQLIRKPLSKLLIGILVLSAFVSIVITYQKDKTMISPRAIEIHYFYIPSCHDCHDQEELLLEFQNKNKNIAIIYHDITTTEGNDFYISSGQAAGITPEEYAIPAVFFNGKFFSGITDAETIVGVDTTLSQSTRQSIDSISSINVPFFGQIEIESLSLPILAIIMGVIDGINPCAMWVLVYLIGLIAGIQNKKRIVFIVGTFVLASGILYFLFMSAWLNVFLLSGSIKIVKIIVGLFAFGSGLGGFFKLIETKGKVVCEIGNLNDKKKLMKKMEKVVFQPMSIALILGVIALAFVVNSVEFLCSSALPAIFTGVLSEYSLSSIQYYGYIGLYTLFFMLDDLIIFSFAAFAVNANPSEHFSLFSKWAGNGILLILGGILLFFPNIL